MQEITKSIHNRKLVVGAKSCGCYHCCGIFEPQRITQWVYDEDTAMCPLCGADAVIPDMGVEDLKSLNRYLFA